MQQKLRQAHSQLTVCSECISHFCCNNSIKTDIQVTQAFLGKHFVTQRMDMFAWCVRLSRLLVRFQTHFHSFTDSGNVGIQHVYCVKCYLEQGN